MSAALIAAGLIAGAGAIRAGGNIAAGAQEFNRDDRARLKELERQQALGRLGMSPAEMQRAQRDVVQPLQAIEREAAQERSAQLAAQDLGQGAAYRQMVAQDQVRQQGRLMAQQMLQQRQEAAIARDEAEIQRLEDMRRRRRQMMLTGGADAIATGLTAGADIQMKQAEIAAINDYRNNVEEIAGDMRTSNQLFQDRYGYGSKFTTNFDGGGAG